MDEKLNKKFRDNVIPLIKALKPHATNILLLENGLVGIESSLEKIRSYAIIDPDYDYTQFLYTYFVMGNISPIATKFKVKKSTVSFISENEQPLLRVSNDDDSTLDSLIVNKSVRESWLESVYESTPLWSELEGDILVEEKDSSFYPTYSGLPQDIRDKKLCQLNVEILRPGCEGVYRAMLSRPFFGETKNTEEILYRLEDVDEKNRRMILKFKQKEPWGNIYHWAAFMMIPIEE